MQTRQLQYLNEMRFGATAPATSGMKLPAKASLNLPENPDMLFADHCCHVRLITTVAEFDALEEDWNKLLQVSKSTVFQTFEWQRTWWKYQSSPQDRLHILLFTLDNRIIGIAPLYRTRRRVFGLPLLRHLQFIGHKLSDYVDFIIQDGKEHIVLNTFVRHLLGTRNEWDVFDIEDVNEGSSSVKFLPGILENHGLSCYLYQGNVCPWISLQASGRTDGRQSDPTASYNFKRKFKRLQQNFASSVEAFQHESDDIQRAVEMFADVHGQRWKSQGYPSAFDDEQFRQYHVEFSRKLARRGWLRMHFLKVDGLPVAVNYSFNYGNRIYMYHSNAHGTEEVMKCSPGYLIRSIAMSEGINEGMTVFDFLRGDETYKYKEWNATDSKNFLVRVSPPSLRGRIRFALFLAVEISAKAQDRVVREYYEFRRFRITERPNIAQEIRYVVNKVSDLGVLGYNFVIRHIPFERIRALQIERTSKHHKAPEQAA